MKVQNVTNGTNIPQEIRLPLLKKGGGNSNVTIKPGEFVYIEERGNNSVLRMYEAKRILTVTEEQKPEPLSYYAVYNNNQVDNILKNAEVTEEVEEVVDENVETESTEEAKEDVKVEITTPEIEIEVIVPEGTIKNKGGRPKGSKNKPKRGRPKKKKAIGRPKKKK
jgi:hypothetical protein